MFGNQWKNSLKSDSFGKMVLIALDLHPIALETPQERELTFLYDSSKLLHVSLIGLTSVLAHPRGHRCGQSDGMLSVARIGSCSYPGRWGGEVYSFKSHELG